jgi:hypothetical protein
LIIANTDFKLKEIGKKKKERERERERWKEYT